MIDLKEKDSFILKSNSIAFVTLEPFLQLPDYIAARFNLKISNVYRGLLLGTGPIVDPGYCGKLSIPLHNLTKNDYEFKGGERIIWMEFTKLSPIPKWQGKEGTAEYYQYNQPHNDWDVEDFLVDAFPNPIDSSLPELNLKTGKALKKITRQASLFNIGLLFTLFTVFGGVGTLIKYFTDEFRSSHRDLNQRVMTDENKIRGLEQRLKQDSIEFKLIEKRLQSANRNSGSPGHR